MVEINESVLKFVCDNLSTKSQQYIQRELFASDCSVNRFFDKSSTLDMSNIQDVIVGKLDDVEKQFFVIRQSLFKRIAGTRRRMDEDDSINITASQSEINKAKELYEQRSARLDELCSDYRKTYHLLNRLLKHRLSDTIAIVLGKNPRILKTMYNGFESGFCFEIVNENTIILSNEQVLGGD